VPVEAKAYWLDYNALYFFLLAAYLYSGYLKYLKRLFVWCKFHTHTLKALYRTNRYEEN
jgi:hypothetical protein